MNKNQKQNIKTLAKELSHHTYDEIQSSIKSFDIETLIELLNSSSRKVGDTAFYCLKERSESEEQIINALLKNRFTRIDSKVRAINFLVSNGCSHDKAIQAYFHILDDKNEEVADNALFGIVFSQNKTHLPILQEKYIALGSDSWLHKQIEKAIEAIKNKNPFIYSPYYGWEGADKTWSIKNAKKKKEKANKALESI